MRLLRRATLRTLCAAIAATLAASPLTAGAVGLPSVDSLWNQPQGLAMDSAFYVLQSWWDRYNRTVSNDPTQRGLDELGQANADLLNAYTLLQHEHAGGAQPVAIIDPLLSTIYDAITGLNVKAPVGSLFAGINRGLLSLEGRGGTGDQVRALLQDYRAEQAAAVRDLHVKNASRYDALLSSNAQREADFLAQVVQVSTAEDGVGSLLADAGTQTASLASQHSFAQLVASSGRGQLKSGASASKNGSQGPGGAGNHDKGRSSDNGGNDKNKSQGDGPKH